MTELQDQLRSARNAYRSTRYPGDLAGELLPRQSLATRAFGGRRWMIAGACSAAAAVLLTLLLIRPSTVSQPGSGQPPAGALTDVRPIARDRMSLPRFETPVLPLLPQELRFQLPPGVENYPHYAMQYRELGIPERLRRQTVPTIPANLPTRGVEWLQRVWVGEKSA